MSDGIKLCDCCGLTYDSPECPYCNRVTDKDRIEELEAKLAQALRLAEKTIDWLDRYGADACKEEAILAELKGQDDE